MTIATETARTGPYTGNSTTGSDGTSVFAYDFKVTDEAHLVVTTKVVSTGVETVEALTTNYTTSGIGDEGGGNVTMVSGSHPLTTETLTISRAVTQSQPTDLVNRAAVSPVTIETGLDRAVQMIQDLDERMERTVKFAVSSDLSSFSADVPEPVASKGVAINATATGFELVDTPNTAAAAASASAAAAAVSATTASNEASAAMPKYTFSTTTTDSDPGAGILRYDNATVASVTEIYIDNTTADAGNPDIAAWLLSWDDSTSTLASQIRLVEAGTPANYAVFNVTAAADSTGYVTLTVAHVDSNGTFADTDDIRISNTRTGDKGDTGTTGATGATGPAGAMGGPASSTDNAITRFNGTGGTVVDDSGWTISDADAMLAGGTLDMNGNAITLDAVTLSGAVTGAAQTISDAVLKDTAETTVAKGNFGATPAWDVSAGNAQWGTVDQAITSSTMTNWPASGATGYLALEVINGAAFAIVWPTSVDWVGGTAPTLTAAGTDQLIFRSRDGGTTVLGWVAGLDIK